MSSALAYTSWSINRSRKSGSKLHRQFGTFDKYDFHVIKDAAKEQLAHFHMVLLP